MTHDRRAGSPECRPFRIAPFQGVRLRRANTDKSSSNARPRACVTGQSFVSFRNAIRETFDRLSKTAAGLWPARGEETRERLTASYQPILQALLYPMAGYFALITGFYALHEEMPAVLLLCGVSSSTGLACLAIRRSMAGRVLTFHGLEARGAALFLLVFAGLIVEQLLRFQPEKLPFFMFLMLVTATASVSVRLAAAAVALCTVTAYLFAGQAGHGMQVDVLHVALGCSLVAFCMTVMTRSVIVKEIRARMGAEDLRRDAQHLADHDALTGLPNRRVFLATIEKRFKRRTGSSAVFAIALVDLDGFKTVNDTFGYAVGDALLVEAARRLDRIRNEKLLVARLGGDKFAILIDGPVGEAMLEELGGTIHAALGKPYEALGIKLSVTATVALVAERINIFTGSEMFERADYALARARAERQGVIVFSSELEKDRRDDSAVEHNLRHCDREREMSLVFQPQIDIETGQTTGFEALARWTNRELGFVPPDVFIRAAERIGVIEELTALFLEKALGEAKAWPETVKLSFNLSIRDILSQTSIDTVCRIVRDSGVAPGRVEFEVTENLIISDFVQADRSVQQLHALGAKVALDDFGVGYANFGHIDRLKINTIKVDRSFVTRLREGNNSGKIIKTMIDMCANLGAGCVVEGVETGEELAALRAMGARTIQGYYFAKPMPREDIPAFLARELADRVATPEGAAATTG